MLVSVGYTSITVNIPTTKIRKRYGSHTRAESKKRRTMVYWGRHFPINHCSAQFAY